MSSAPLVVVLGRPNVGKSSVVAALAAVADVEVDARPFTTTEPREVGIEAGGRVHLRLLDTPGLQEASRALQVAREHLSTDPSDPAQGLPAFLNQFASGEEFREEVLALSILASGGWFVLVVDGSRPFRPNAEAEMALLRWVGRPGLAVVNRTTSTGPDHSSEWEAALRKYFPEVRRFGSHRASTEERLDLIEALGLLHPDLADAARSFREGMAKSVGCAGMTLPWLSLACSSKTSRMPMRSWRRTRRHSTPCAKRWRPGFMRPSGIGRGSLRRRLNASTGSSPASSTPRRLRSRPTSRIYSPRTSGRSWGCLPTSSSCLALRAGPPREPWWTSRSAVTAWEVRRRSVEFSGAALRQFELHARASVHTTGASWAPGSGCGRSSLEIPRRHAS